MYAELTLEASDRAVGDEVYIAYQDDDIVGRCVVAYSTPAPDRMPAKITRIHNGPWFYDAARGAHQRVTVFADVELQDAQ